MDFVIFVGAVLVAASIFG